MLTLDCEGKFTVLNPAAEHFFDRPAAELLGQPFTTVLDSFSYAKAQLMLDRTFQDGGVEDWELDCIGAGGELILVGYTTSVIRSATGVISGLVAVGLDLTEKLELTKQLAETNQKLEGALLQLEKAHTSLSSYAEDLERQVAARTAELRQALAKEKELNTLRSDIVTTVSHEFRTPLTMIQSASELLHRYGDKMTPERRSVHLATIQAQVSYMTKMLEDTVTLENINTEKFAFHPARLDLTAFCEALLEDFQRSTPTHHFSFTSEANVGVFALDANLLRFILDNLLSNAVKYSAVASSISLNLRRSSDQIMLQVQDEGIGIPPEDQPHVFEAFYRAKNAGQTSGTGLGLTIVKQMVERHGGRITFESHVGVGTTFTIIVPALPSSE